MPHPLFEGKKDVKTVRLPADAKFFEDARRKLRFEFDIDLVVFCASIGLYRSAFKGVVEKQNSPSLKKLSSITVFETARLFDFIIMAFLNIEKNRMEEFEAYFYTGFSILKDWFDTNEKNMDSTLDRFSGIIEDLLKVDPQLIEEHGKIEQLYELLKRREDETLEFKSSLIWDYKSDHPNKDLEMVIVRNIAAFMNARGGTLLVGVDDEGNVLGIEKDFAVLGKKNWDEWFRAIVSLVNSHIGKEFYQFVKEVKPITYEGKMVAKIRVDRSPMPAFIDPQGKAEFYIREGASTQMLNPKQVNAYIRDHWNNS